MAYKCRAYPDGAQQQMLARTFGCVRLVWNRTLAERRRLYHGEGKGLSYAASDAALTVMKRDPGLAFLAEVSCVPLQQTLRHQHKAFICPDTGLSSIWVSENSACKMEMSYR